MADKTYADAAGIVQFDVKTREAGNQTVRDVTIKTAAQKLVSITVWPDFDDVEIKKGDFVAVSGEYKVNTKQKDDGGSVEYHNISANSLVVVPGAPKRAREVVTSGGGSSKPAF